MDAYTGTDIYCDLIIPRKLAVKIVKETDTVLAYHHTRSHWPVHIVVTPKAHVASLLELDDYTLAKELLEVVKEVARSVKEAEGACRVVTNLGDYQDSKHLHVHIISGESFVKR